MFRDGELTSKYANYYRKKDRRIDFMIDRRWEIANINHLSSSERLEREDSMDERTINMYNDGFSDFDSMTDHEFAELYIQERNKLRREIKAYIYKPGPSELQHYRDLETWSRTDALSLWMDAAPKINDSLIVWAQKNQRLSKTAKAAVDRWRLMEQASCFDVLGQRCAPAEFSSWAKKTSYPFPNFFLEFLPESSSTQKTSEEFVYLLAENVRLREVISNLKHQIEDLNDPKLKHFMQWFGALCLGVYGWVPDNEEKNMNFGKIAKTLKYYNDKSDPKTIRRWIFKSVATLPDSPKKNLVLHYEANKLAEGEFQPELGDPPRSVRIPPQHRP